MSLFEVKDNNNLFRINMQERMCSCHQFEIDEIPCSHAMAIFEKQKLNWYDYCSKFYKKEIMLATYEETINPVRDPETWNVLEHVL